MLDVADDEMFATVAMRAHTLDGLAIKSFMTLRHEYSGTKEASLCPGQLEHYNRQVDPDRARGGFVAVFAGPRDGNCRGCAMSGDNLLLGEIRQQWADRMLANWQ